MCAARVAVLLVLSLLSSTNGGNSSSLDQYQRFRNRCERLQKDMTSGKLGYTFHDEWKNMDCNFWSTRDAAGAEIGTYVYRYLSYPDLVQRMQVLADLYPSLVRLQTAQDRYDLPPAGMCSQDTHGIQPAACRVWILELGSEDDKVKDKPQVRNMCVFVCHCV